MKIHIMGASCAGSTTLGNALSQKMGIPYFDTDDFFWEVSETPYTIKKGPGGQETNAPGRYRAGRQTYRWRLSRQLGDHWLTAFDLVVFLYVPNEIRMQRLVNRELERYGDIIYTDPERNRLFNDFYNWASSYDDESFTGRNVGIHQEWLKSVPCPVLEIRGDTTVNERLEIVSARLMGWDNRADKEKLMQ